MPLKAIETRYAGHRFRSRLEARWAVVLDHLNVKWLYEHEGFETKHGRYLPDFWLPDFNTFLEIKSGQPTDIEKAKLRSVIKAKQAFGAFGLPLNQKVQQSFGRLTSLAKEAPFICLHWHPIEYGAFKAQHEIRPGWASPPSNAVRPPLWPDNEFILAVSPPHYDFNTPLTCPECGAGEGEAHFFDGKTRGQADLPNSFGSILGLMCTLHCYHLWALMNGERGLEVWMTIKDNVDPLEFALRCKDGLEAIDAGRTARFEHGQSPR